MRLTRCPVCRARLRGDEALELPCRRCSADLGLVRAAERYAEALQARARVAMAAGDSVSAVKLAREAVGLVNHEHTRRTLAAALHQLRRG